MALWDPTLAGPSNLENTMHFVVQLISCRPSWWRNHRTHIEAPVPLFRPLSFVRVSLQAALSTHINSAMYSQKGCVVQDWLILQKRSYSGFHSWNLAPLHGYLSYDSLLHRKSKALPQKDYKRICPGCLKYATKNFLKSRRKLLLATQAKRSNFYEKRSLINV